MADTAISALTELTAAATGDLIPIVDVSEANTAIKTKKITWANLIGGTPVAWTPTVTYFGGTTNPTSWAYGTCSYVKLGRMVTCNIAAYLTRGSGNRTHVYFSLPFTSAVGDIPALCNESISAAGFQNIIAYFDNTTRVVCVLAGAMANDGTIQLSFSYFATA